MRLLRPPSALGVDAALAATFAVFADPEVVVGNVLAQDSIKTLLLSLDHTECLHLDPGGASCWSIAEGTRGVRAGPQDALNLRSRDRRFRSSCAGAMRALEDDQEWISLAGRTRVGGSARRYTTTESPGEREALRSIFRLRAKCLHRRRETGVAFG